MSRALIMTLGLSAALLTPLTAQAPAGIERVKWLQGCWEMTSGDRVVEEQWMAPRARTMIGSGRTVRGDRLVEYEQVILREQDGQLAYEAHPSGQPTATFTSKTITDAMVVFENAEHDFPQRVGYQHDRPDTLLAWIEGTVKGQTRKVEFPYTRVACPGK